MTIDRVSIDPDTLREAEEEKMIEACKLQLPSRYLSVSQVVMYLRCGLSYQFRYVDGIKLRPNVGMVEGSSVHRGLEVGLRDQKRYGRPSSFSAMMDGWNEKWKQEKKEMDCGGENLSKVERELTKRGRFFMGEYYKNHMPKVKPRSVEERFMVSIGEELVPVVGYVDLVDDREDGPLVVDHKVVGIAKSQSAADGDLQLTTYAYASGSKDVQFNSFVRTKTPKISVVGSKRDARDFLWAEKIITDVARAISAGVFMPCDPGNWNCSPKWCGYWKHCRRK